MSAQPQSRPYRAEDLLAPEFEGRHAELYAGMLARDMSPSYGDHGGVAARILMRFGVSHESLAASLRDRLAATTAETAFLLSTAPDTLLVLDVAIVDLQTQPDALARAFPKDAPYIAIEVRSAANSSAELQPRAALFLAAGSAEVWIADPGARELRVIDRAGERCFRKEDRYEGAGLLAGFSFLAEQLFPPEKRL